MMPLVVASLAGVSVVLFVWALRGPLRARWQHDVTWVEHAVWRFTPEPVNARRYVAIYYGVAVLLLFALLLVLSNRILAVVIWVVLMAIPRIAVDRAWANHRKKIEAQLSGTVRQMSSSVGSGMTLAQAIGRLAHRAPDPIRVEFRLMTGYWQAGADLSATIEAARRRLQLPSFDLFASALLVNQRLGGNVSATLDRLAGSLEAIERMRQEVHAATAEGRTNIKVLAVAPFIMLGLVALMDSDAVLMLFTRPVGHLLLGIVVTLTAAGTYWAWKVVHADV